MERYDELSKNKVSVAGVWLSVAVLLVVVLFVSVLVIGPVNIPFEEIISIIFGEQTDSYSRVIILESRLPMAIAAFFAGATLSVAGLLMQAVFQNPLAGPSVLGVSSGASLGVAVVMLGGSLLGGVGYSISNEFCVIGALSGAALVIFLLLLFAGLLRSNVTLLIGGMMLSYVIASLISLLNFFAPPESVKGYVIWGMGSLTGLRLEDCPVFITLSVVSLVSTFFFLKPLDALLLGERYASSMGYSMSSLRIGLLCVTGLLVAVPTAYCGPIGFIGLVVPHLCRLCMKTSGHKWLFPGSVVIGGLVTLACALLCIIPSGHWGVLPINVITPLIGVPVILYLLVNRSKILYFN